MRNGYGNKARNVKAGALRCSPRPDMIPWADPRHLLAIGGGTTADVGTSRVTHWQSAAAPQLTPEQAASHYPAQGMVSNAREACRSTGACARWIVVVVSAVTAGEGWAIGLAACGLAVKASSYGRPLT